jgi:hypothetical protein
MAVSAASITITLVPQNNGRVPGAKKNAKGLKKVFQNCLCAKMTDIPDFSDHVATMFSPCLLQSAKVPTCKLLQNKGQHVVTFPQAFHRAFSMGPNIGVAANFATHDWIACGASRRQQATPTICSPCCFSHVQTA